MTKRSADRAVHRKYAAGGILALALLAQQAIAATTITGSGVNNGDFNSTYGADNDQFDDTPDWWNLGTGDQTVQATKTDQDVDGTRNAAISSAAARLHSQNTGYTISEGDTFSISYVWRDAFNWDDGQDQVNVRLWITDTDLIGGTQTELASFLSGLSSADSSYQSASGSSSAAGASFDGKTLFLSIEVDDGNSDGNDFARFDNLTLIANPDPIPTLSEWGLIILLALFVLVMGRRIMKQQPAAEA